MKNKYLDMRFLIIINTSEMLDGLSQISWVFKNFVENSKSII